MLLKGKTRDAQHSRVFARYYVRTCGRTFQKRNLSNELTRSQESKDSTFYFLRRRLQTGRRAL